MTSRSTGRERTNRFARVAGRQRHSPGRNGAGNETGIGSEHLFEVRQRVAEPPIRLGEQSALEQQRRWRTAEIGDDVARRLPQLLRSSAGSLGARGSTAFQIRSEPAPDPRKKFADHGRNDGAPAMQHHPAESGIGKRCIDDASRLIDRASMRANPCFDLSRCHEKASAFVADFNSLILKRRSKICRAYSISGSSPKISRRSFAGRVLMADYPIASSGRRRCVFVTVLWGDWHRNIFLDANLPTMLSPGNLPALAAGIDCEYLVYTTSKDALQMTRNRAFQRLRSIVPVSLKLFTPSKTKNIFSLHHEIWRAATEHARRQRSVHSA